ncbi:MAG: hypothetical protein ABI361_04735 [Nitrososphaera sp.]|jgi:hypothetical protein
MHSLPDAEMQTNIVELILTGKTEESLALLSKYYNMQPPGICVGTVKGKRRTAYAVYVAREKRIYAMNSEIFFNPFVMLHEFYHHLRSRSGAHRGTERHANLFAKAFIESYLNEKGKSGARSPPSSLKIEREPANDDP